MRRSLLSGRNALINLFIAAFVIFIVFNVVRGNEDNAEPPRYRIPDTSNQLRLSAPISASQYMEVDGKPFLLLMSKQDNERIETADLRIISVDPAEDLEQEGWIHTSMSVQRPPEALTYAMGHVYVGLTREGDERPALWVVDLSNPDRPFEANLLHAEMPIRSLAASEDEYMVAAGFNDELLIYDISHPNEPVATGSFTVDIEMPPILHLHDSTLIVEHSAGLILFDMTNPNEPRKISSFDHPDWQTPSFVPEPDTFLIGDEGFSTNIPTGAYLDLDVTGEIIALAAGESGITLVNVNDQSAPREIAALPIDGRVASVTLDDDRVYALSGRLSQGNRVQFAVHTVDISDPTAPRAIESAPAINGLPRYQNVIARDGNVWILVNSIVYRYRTSR